MASPTDLPTPPATPGPSAASAPPRPAPAARPSLWSAHLELGKARLNALVVFTTALGFIAGSRSIQSPSDDFFSGVLWTRLLWTCLGTFLAAAGASAFNQALEARRDALMLRTRHRPLCTGRLTRTYAAALGLILCISGIALLVPLANALTAALAAGNVLLYVLLYTPLKPVSTINTLVGAVVGGVPPVLGWTAATGQLAPGALVLGTILFVWQIPHFLARCWMAREDYARGGFKMLPLVDATGRLTSRLALLYAILLMPLCLLVHFLRHAGMPFVVISFLLTLALLGVALRFAFTRAHPDARRLFLAGIIYLPILCLTLMLDARTPELERLRAVQTLADDPAFIDPGSEEGRLLNASLTTPVPPQSRPATQQP